MNKIKNSITLIVALATIGITLMSNKVVTREKKIDGTMKCFKDPITVNLFCDGWPEIISSSTTCDQAEGFEFYKAHVFNLDSNNYIEYEDVFVQCQGGDAFCCVQLTPDVTHTGGNFEGPCPGQPYYNLEGTNARYEIFQVYCKYN